MKVLTIRQPWAWAIARGHKPVENRSWLTAYRGPLANHAAVSLDRGTGAYLLDADKPAPEDDDPLWLARGALISVHDLVDVLDHREMDTCDCGPWAIPRNAHWQLANPRPLAEPIAVKGRLGLWETNLVAA